MGDQFSISIDNLRNGWVDIRLAKGDKAYSLEWISYATDFVADLAKMALDGLFFGQARIGIWFDSEGSGWVLRYSHGMNAKGMELQCGKCHDFEEAELLTKGGEASAWLNAQQRFESQRSFFQVEVSLQEFAEAVIKCLTKYELEYAVDGIVPCDNVSQPNRPIAAIKAAMEAPFKSHIYVDDSDIVGRIILVSNENPLQEYKK